MAATKPAAGRRCSCSRNQAVVSSLAFATSAVVLLTVAWSPTLDEPPARVLSVQLAMDTNTTTRLAGRLHHSNGTLIFDSTPHNFSIVHVAPGGAPAANVLSVAKHCVPGSDCSSADGTVTVLSAGPTVRYVLLEGGLFALPAGVDAADVAAVLENRGAPVGQEEEAETLLRFFESHSAHLALLERLYEELYREHGIIGRQVPSAIPLYVTGLLFSNAVADDPAQQPIPPARRARTRRRARLEGGYKFSRRRDCHFDDTPSPCLLKRLLKGEGGAAE